MKNLGYRTFISALLFLSCATLSYSDTDGRSAYILKYKDIAIKEMQLTGIPASITLAQGCLESGDGLSTLAVKANNHFGIKCHDWNGKSITRDDDRKNECFRKYDTAEESYRDHSNFLRYRDRYAFLFNLDPTDYKGWAYGLKKAGYATDPNYAASLIRIIEEYRLYQYDTSISLSELPPTPSESRTPFKITPPKGSILYTISLQRDVLSINGVACIISNGYETYSMLAKEYDLFKNELLRFNDLKKECDIPAGTVIFLEKKHKRSDPNLKMHVVEEGESLYELSQRYGVQLKYLYKYNELHKGDRLVAGSIIKLTDK